MSRANKFFLDMTVQLGLWYAILMLFAYWPDIPTKWLVVAFIGAALTLVVYFVAWVLQRTFFIINIRR